MKMNFFKLKLVWFFLMALLSGVATAQERTISGMIIDADTKEPLIGVTVLIEGTFNGTVTDFDGNYTIKASQGQNLVFSFVGYQSQTVAVAALNKMDIALSADTKGIEEVVVIGYGTVKKSDATGSVATVSAKDFNNGAITSPEELIAGKMSGVTITTSGGAPGAGSTIRVRGGSSLSAKNDPLIVIDGVPVDNEGISGMANPLSTIHPSDIETFTVLKDASATAIYGSRASNGVIIITTKKGKAGRPISVNYAGNVSVGTLARTIDVLNGNQFREVVESLSPGNTKVGTFSTNWQNEIFSPAISTDHNISLSGAMDFMPYRLSYGYTNQDGLLETSKMERSTLSMNLSPTFFDNHLTFNLNGKFTFAKNRFADQGAIGNALRFDPTQPVYADGFDSFGGFYTEVDNDRLPNKIAPVNPVSMLELRNDNAEVGRFLGNAQVDYKFHFLPELKASLNVGMDRSETLGRVDVSDQASWLYQTNQAGELDGGARRRYSQIKTNELLDFYFNYNKKLDGIKSHLDVTGGYSWQHFAREGEAFETNVAGTREYENSSYFTENYLVSVFGRLNYTFNDRYLLTATVRRDGSSRFSEDNRWGIFPSVALGWNIKEESFLKNAKALSELKLRLGWGITGQQDINNGDYPYLPRYTVSENGADYFGDETLRPEGYDANLKWEETTTYNAAIDYGFFNNRLSGSLEVYKRVTDDLLNVIPVPAGTNLTNRILTNVGSLENRGIEFSVNGKIISKSDLSWEVGLNAAYNQNEITKLTATDDPTYKGVMTGHIAGGTGNTVQIHSVGHPAYSFYLYEQVYDAAGRPVEGAFVDQNNDGKIDENDLRHYKNASPAVTMGISSRFAYKNWDFSFAGRASMGNWVYNNVFSDRGSSNDIVHTTGYLSNVVTDWYNTGFTTNNNYLSDHYVSNASFFKMDNITLGYTFPKVKGLTGLRLYSTVQNAFVISKYKGMDPEVFNGIDNNVYPRPRTFLFGVNLSF